MAKVLPPESMAKSLGDSVGASLAKALLSSYISDARDEHGELMQELQGSKIVDELREPGVGCLGARFPRIDKLRLEHALGIFEKAIVLSGFLNKVTEKDTPSDHTLCKFPDEVKDLTAKVRVARGAQAGSFCDAYDLRKWLNSRNCGSVQAVYLTRECGLQASAKMRPSKMLRLSFRRKLWTRACMIPSPACAAR